MAEPDLKRIVEDYIKQKKLAERMIANAAAVAPSTFARAGLAEPAAGYHTVTPLGGGAYDPSLNPIRYAGNSPSRVARFSAVRFDKPTGRLECALCGGSVLHCKHIEDYLSSSRVAASILLMADEPGYTHALKIPLAKGLVLDELALRIDANPRRPDLKRIIAIYSTEHQDNVIWFELNVVDGESLNTAVKAIEDYYRCQPEYEELSRALNMEDIPCSAWDHKEGTYYPEVVNHALVRAEGTAQELRETLILAHVWARLNTPGPAARDGLCFLCFVKSAHCEWSSK